MKGWIGCAGALLCIACLAGCDRSSRTVPADFHADEELVVYCPHPLEFINPIVSEFEEQTGIKVEVCTGGTGELLKMAEDRKEPECDIFWGGSLSTTMAQSELFEPYISKNESMIQEDYRNKEGNMTRFTDVPSILMVNTNLAGDLSIEGYGDLLKPELSGKIAMCDPVTSSSAFEHLINMLYAMGEGEPEEGWDYVEAFCKNLDGKLLQSSSEVYQGVAGGRYTVGLTFEEGAAHYIASGYPVRVVYMEEGVISKPDVVCIIKGSGHMWEAKQFVDFVTGKDAQTVISESLGRRSVRTDVDEPEYLLDKQAIRIIYDEEAVVKENKLEWKRRFSEVFQGTLK
ncbi:MAG: ABC transporter substrate-binding protein [Hungatella sp.]|jgi:iron(III) transport system substrate-binding protein|nr:ABC transporter substrate-binding protein [Hungatella sp.]